MTHETIKQILFFYFAISLLVRVIIEFSKPLDNPLEHKDFINSIFITLLYTFLMAITSQL